MVQRLTTAAADFDGQLTTLLSRKQEASPAVAEAVRGIIQQVIKEGDGALRDLTRRFDSHEADSLAISVAERDAAADRASPEAVAALEAAAARIETYHRKQMPDDELYTDEEGVTLGWRWTPLEAVGLYVPGGLASYPSSVLMNAIPPRVAAVPRMVMVVPTPDGQINPLVMAAARICGIEEIYRIGGAQAVAALAYGTETIASVDKIVGPGNAYVAAAKREVFGHVGIDSIAGPSEIVVVSDNRSPAPWVAADLLSQAEHDPSSQSILITDDAAFADAVEGAAEDLLAVSPREAITRRAWEQNSALIVVRRLGGDGMEVVNRLAPEHLELAVDKPEDLLPSIRHAGAIFLGRHTPEAVGDYVAGPNHVLPTARAARFSSGLSVADFLKRSSLIGCSAESLEVIGPLAMTLAEKEGLWAHGESVRQRLEDRGQ
ncbi:histidinol dehydrogenase [Parvularcula bermudensis HTCC2503]|uniref:Histidinol dehydrogenase n=1 Tax=Parvularcula bermudensis (strain ATCC BAA-594 / HTCC2503 / KCTC 12087) TaxID=314260 RepID=E0TBY6_PARBH|nr:histidinol dehydrogenase [Parvularcula bermudensis]ADM08479.1 histidinol dehydrogenase [Parvularcula bermudensis HTCC2503]